MSWNELQLDIPYLEADIVEKVYENIDYIRDRLIQTYSVDLLVNPNVSFATQIYEVQSKLQDIENDLTKIEGIGGYESIYYEAHKTIDDTFILADYQRWVLMLNDMYAMVIGGKGRWGVLRLSDCIPTIDSKTIAIRGDN